MLSAAGGQAEESLSMASKRVERVVLSLLPRHEAQSEA
jgi:hypothetical protein